MARRGRPPKVVANGTEFTTTVKGQKYTFKAGDDGRLRALGNPARDDDFNYAREQVQKAQQANDGWGNVE